MLSCPRCRTGIEPGHAECPRCGAAGVTAAAAPVGYYPPASVGYYPPAATGPYGSAYPTPGPAAGAGYGYGYGPPGGWQPPVTPWQGPPGFAYPPDGPGSLSSWGLRLCGRLIDGALFLVPGIVVLLVLLSVLPEFDGWSDGTLTSTGTAEEELFGDFVAVVVAVLVAGAVMTVLHATYTILLTARRGGTLGHTMLGMEVRGAVTGERVGLGQSAGRYFAELGLMAALGVAAVVVPVPLQLLDALWAAWDDRNQTLHDKAAGTIVINTR